MARPPIPRSFPGASGALKQSLERFADEVVRFADATDSAFDARPSVPTPAYRSTSIAYGQLLRIDPKGGVVVVSPPPTVSQTSQTNQLSRNGGARFEIAIIGAGTVIVRPSSATIDGETERVFSELGLVIVRFDGTNFHTTRGGAPSRTFEWRGSVATMSPTLSRYLPVADTDPTGGGARSYYTIREPGIACVARELQLFRYGQSGAPVPTHGPSGVTTGAGNFLYSLEVNGSVRATGAVPTAIAYRSISLVASLAATDQVAVRVNTFSGAQWSGIASFHHAVLSAT